VKTRPAGVAGTQQNIGAKAPCRPPRSCTGLATIFTSRKRNLSQNPQEKPGLLPFCINMLPCCEQIGGKTHKMPPEVADYPVSDRSPAAIHRQPQSR
jgi:hypothetical protein